MEQKPSDEAQKTFDFSSLWSLKTSMKNVAHFMLVAGLVYFQAMPYLMVGLILGAVFAGGLLWKKKDLEENGKTICKGYLYLFLKTVLFAILVYLVI